MIGRGDDYGVERFVVQRFAEILHALRLLSALRRGDRLADRAEQPAIDIADVSDLAIFPGGERRRKLAAAAANADDGHHNSFVGRRCPRAEAALASTVRPAATPRPLSANDRETRGG